MRVCWVEGIRNVGRDGLYRLHESGTPLDFSLSLNLWVKRNMTSFTLGIEFVLRYSTGLDIHNKLFQSQSIVLVLLVESQS